MLISSLGRAKLSWTTVVLKVLQCMSGFCRCDLSLQTHKASSDLGIKGQPINCALNARCIWTGLECPLYTKCCMQFSKAVIGLSWCTDIMPAVVPVMPAVYSKLVTSGKDSGPCSPSHLDNAQELLQLQILHLEERLPRAQVPTIGGTLRDDFVGLTRLCLLGRLYSNVAVGR